MNYSRRPNRPDGNVYREMRRRNMGRGHGGGGGLPFSPKVLLVVACVVVITLGAWAIWK